MNFKNLCSILKKIQKWKQGADGNIPLIIKYEMFCLFDFWLSLTVIRSVQPLASVPVVSLPQ